MSDRQLSLDGFGVSSATRHRISTDDLIDELLRLADEVGGQPTMAGMDELGAYSATMYKHRFGSWNGAVEAAGLEPNEEKNMNTDRDVMVGELRRVADEVGGTPTIADMNDLGAYNASTYQNHFGSWNAALTEAGLKPNKVWNIDRDALIEELHRVVDEVGGTPTKDDMDKTGKYSSAPYYNEFGSWNAALGEAGFEPNHEVNIGRDALIGELYRVADKVGRSPRVEDMDEIGVYSVRPYQDQFGSWNGALAAAGLDVNKEHTVDRDTLIDELHRLKDKIGKTPGGDEMNESGRYAATTYKNHFGSWNDAIDAAGLDMNVEKNIDTDTLVADVHRLERELGRRPTWNDVRHLGKYSAPTYGNHFGSWAKALKAAGYKDPGYVYITRYGSERVKIGKSTNPTRRMVQLGHPDLHIAVEHEHHSVAEQNLHDEFSYKHIKGELFALDNDDVEELVARLRGWARTFGTDVIEPTITTDGGVDDE